MRKHYWLGVFSLIGIVSVTATKVNAQTPDCASLPSRAPAGVALSAEVVAADSVRPPGVPAGPMLAGHCMIKGKMNDRIGQDGSTMRFELCRSEVFIRHARFLRQKDVWIFCRKNALPVHAVACFATKPQVVTGNVHGLDQILVWTGGLPRWQFKPQTFLQSPPDYW